MAGTASIVRRALLYGLQLLLDLCPIGKLILSNSAWLLAKNAGQIPWLDG